MFIRSAQPPRSLWQRDRALEARLQTHVERYSKPRHFTAQRAENKWVAEQLRLSFEASGYEVHLQGPYENVVALPPKLEAPITLVGAHYDSVPGSPGADDNASGLAVMLELARAPELKNKALGFVGFNCEEDGLLGSENFVADYQGPIRLAHILEMVGYCDRTPQSQRAPISMLPGLPHTGDFVGVIGNKGAAKDIDELLATVKGLSGSPKLIALKANSVIEKMLPDIRRSDHAPFWDAGIPAIMWTDTSEFRNPHYHRASDLPETLDYPWMAQITKLFIEILKNLKETR